VLSVQQLASAHVQNLHTSVRPFFHFRSCPEAAPRFHAARLAALGSAFRCSAPKDSRKGCASASRSQSHDMGRRHDLDFDFLCGGPLLDTTPGLSKAASVTALGGPIYASVPLHHPLRIACLYSHSTHCRVCRFFVLTYLLGTSMQMYYWVVAGHRSCSSACSRRSARSINPEGTGPSSDDSPARREVHVVWTVSSRLTDGRGLWLSLRRTSI